VMPVDSYVLGRALIDFDPAYPNSSDFATATEIAAALANGVVAEPVAWPAGLAPEPQPPANPPKASDPLPPCDVLVVTWTSGEARTLSALFTPGAPLEQWFEYKSNLDEFIPKVTGPKAPFNDSNPRNARYYHSLGLYYPVKLAGQRVLCLKSGLHMDYDGPAFPIVDFWKQVIAETGAKLVITTGTGGGIGSNVLLGDVVIAQQTVFDCTTQFKSEPFHNQSFDTSVLADNPVARLSGQMLKPNADRVLAANCPSHSDGLPAFFYRGSSIASPKIVTTDFFAFDNTTNTNGLQQLGNVCDMGDASLGLAVSQIDAAARPRWAAIRNASDPQMDGSLPPKTQHDGAGAIYKHYGSFTTAASVLATWSLICEVYAPPQGAAARALALVAPSPEPPSAVLAKAERRRRQFSLNHILLQIAASSDLTFKDFTSAEVPAETALALKARLIDVNVDPGTSSIDYRLIQFVDEAKRVQQFVLAQVANDDAEAFRGSYLFSGADIVAQEQFTSS
jgi:hypothetical protein